MTLTVTRSAAAAYVVRALRWGPLATAAALCVGLWHWRAMLVGADADGLLTLRIVMLLLAVGCSGVFDDPADGILAASPTSLRTRRCARAFAVAAPALALWCVALAMTPAAPRLTVAYGGVAVEALATFAVVIAVSATAARLGIHEPGRLVGAVLGPVVLAAAHLPEPILLATAREDDSWRSAHLHWALLAGTAGVIAFVATIDPACGGRIVRRRACRPGPARSQDAWGE